MFEYNYVTIDTNQIFWNKDFIEECNKMGSEFWELVTVINDSSDYRVAIFKRPSYGTP